jgi:hypothetical protein
LASSYGKRFLAAFNDIEDFFRLKLGEDKYADFAQLERAYAASTDFQVSTEKL